MAVTPPDPSIPRGPLAAAIRTTALARRQITSLARRERSRPNFLAELVNIARRATGDLTDAFARGQVEGWVGQASRIVRALGIEPPDDSPPFDSGRTFTGRVDPTIRYVATEKATEYLRNRIDFTPAEFEQLDADARRAAFTVARTTTADAVQAVREALADDVARGGTLRAFRETVAEALDGSGLSESQVEAIYRTQVGRAQAAGQIAVLESPFVADAFPYLLYSATHDGRVRPEHLAMESLGLNGTAVYRRDDPVWDTHYPPWAWNCRCVVIPLSVEDAAARGVREAIEWLRSGRPPVYPEFVPPPPFSIPKGWVPTGRRLTAVY